MLFSEEEHRCDTCTSAKRQASASEDKKRKTRLSLEEFGKVCK